MALVECALLTITFWPETALNYLETANSDNANDVGTRVALFKVPYAQVSWLCAIFLLGYVGTEVSLEGWVVQFMLRVRSAKPFDAGMISVGFWLELTVGRATLGFATPRIGVKLSLVIYIPVTMGLELIFWLVPSFYASTVAVALQGFFLDQFVHVSLLQSQNCYHDIYMSAQLVSLQPSEVVAQLFSLSRLEQLRNLKANGSCSQLYSPFSVSCWCSGHLYRTLLTKRD